MKTLYGVYRSVCLSADADAKTVSCHVPQVFADETVTILDVTGGMPEVGSVGWVAFESGFPDRPVWLSSGGSEADNEVWVGPDPPLTPKELWYDTDAVPASLPATPASAVTFTPTGTIAATNVQAAVAEVASEAAPVSLATSAPRGLVALQRGSHGGTAVPSTNLTIYNLTFPMTAGRAYQASFTVRAVLGYGNVFRFLNTWDVTPPGPAVDVWNINYGNGQWDSGGWSWVVQPTVTRTYNLQIQATVPAGGASGQIHTGSSQAWVEDIGLAVTETTYP